MEHKKKLRIPRNRCIVLTELVMIAITVSLLIVASFYTFPSADDYNYSIRTHKAAESGNIFNVLGAAVDTEVAFTQTWLALYSPAMLQSLQPAIFGDQYYWLTCPFLLVFSFAGFAILVRALVVYLIESKSLIWLPIASFLWLFFILTMPSTSEGLYWWNGGMNYIPFWSLAAADIALMIKYYCGAGKTAPTIVLASIIAFIVAGGTQVNSFALILMLAYLCVLSIVKKRRFLGVIPLVIAICGFLAMALHPGTAARGAALGVHQTIWHALYLALNSMRNVFVRDVGIELVLFFCMLIPLFFLLVSEKHVTKRFFSPRIALIFMALSVLYLLGICFVPAYSLASEGPGRLQNVVYATFVILMSMEMFLLCGIVYSKMKTTSQSTLRASWKPSRALLYASLALLLLFVVPNNLTTAMKELSNGSLQYFSQEMKERQELVNAGHGENVVVPALKHKPSLTFFDDIQADPKDWRNQSYALYHSLLSVQTEKKNPN